MVYDMHLFSIYWTHLTLFVLCGMRKKGPDGWTWLLWWSCAVLVQVAAAATITQLIIAACPRDPRVCAHCPPPGACLAPRTVPGHSLYHTAQLSVALLRQKYKDSRIGCTLNSMKEKNKSVQKYPKTEAAQ